MGLPPLTAATLADLRAARLTYPEIGATRGDLPAGYHHLAHTASLGTGRARFEQVAAGVLGWAMHRRAGLAVQR